MKCFTILSIQCTIFFVTTSVCLFAKDWIPQPYGLSKISNLKLSENIKTAQDMLQKAPEDAEAWGNLAKIYHIHGWEAEAIQCYKRATEIGETVGQVGEGRLLVMSSLLIADELSEAYDEMERLQVAAKNTEDTIRGETRADLEAKVVPVIESLTARIENIAAGLESD